MLHKAKGLVGRDPPKWELGKGVGRGISQEAMGKTLKIWKRRTGRGVSLSGARFLFSSLK